MAVVQSFAAATFVYQQGVVVTSTLEFYISTVVCLVTGTMFSNVVRRADLPNEVLVMVFP